MFFFTLYYKMWGFTLGSSFQHQDCWAKEGFLHEMQGWLTVPHARVGSQVPDCFQSSLQRSPWDVCHMPLLLKTPQLIHQSWWTFGEAMFPCFSPCNVNVQDRPAAQDQQFSHSNNGVCTLWRYMKVTESESFT